MPERPTHILGISCFYHDAVACLVTGGEIVAAAEEERLTRRKHDPSFPAKAIAFCLAEAGIDVGSIDHVVFHEKPFVKFERIAETFLATAPRGVRTFLHAIPPWAKEKLFVADILARETGYAGRLPSAAKRELVEETGLTADLWLCGTVIVDAGEVGIGLYIFSGECDGDPKPSEEGLAEWIPYDFVAGATQNVPKGYASPLPVVEDLPVLLEKIHGMQRGDPPFHARSFYDEDGKLVVVFGENGK